MQMKEAMAALSGGQVVDTQTLFGGANAAPPGGGSGASGGTTTQARGERQVSLG